MQVLGVAVSLRMQWALLPKELQMMPVSSLLVSMITEAAPLEHYWWLEILMQAAGASLSCKRCLSHAAFHLQHQLRKLEMQQASPEHKSFRLLKAMAVH